MKKISMLLCAGVLMSALGVAFVACNDGTEDPKTKGVDVPFTEYSFEEGGPGEEISAKWVNLPKENNTLLVINSDEELKKYVEGDYPPVDFAEHTLVLAQGRATNGINKIDAKLTRNNDEYLLNIHVKLNMTDVAEGWFLALIIPKLSEQEQVKLNIKYEKQ